MVAAGLMAGHRIRLTGRLLHLSDFVPLL